VENNEKKHVQIPVFTRTFYIECVARHGKGNGCNPF